MRYVAAWLVMLLTTSALADEKQLVFDCADGSKIVATYGFQPPRLTPLRASAEWNGKSRDLMRDKDDTSGWGFSDGEVWVWVGGARLIRGTSTIECKIHDALPGGGVPAAIAAQASPTPAVKPVAPAAPRPAPVVATPTAPPPQAAGVFVICRADRSPGEPHFYNPPVDGNGGTYDTWHPAYQSYLVDKHHFKGSGVGCSKYPTASAAQVDFDQWVANARHDAAIPGANFTVIVTDWRFK